VGGIFRLLPVRQVASGVLAVCRQDMKVIVSAGVTRSARHVRMPIGQRKINRRGIVIEFCSHPGIDGVTRFASGGEIRSDVIWIRGLLKILQVARNAGSRQSQILSDGSALVTLIAFHYRVCAKQGKSVEVLLDRLNRDIPSQDRVAFSAVGAELTAVDVRMAVRTILSHIGEDRFSMALRAVNFFVHSSKGIPRGIVIELGNGANRRPASARVAVLAWNGKGSMRTPTRLSLPGHWVRKGKQKYTHREPESDWEGSRDDVPLLFLLSPSLFPLWGVAEDQCLDKR